MQDPDFQNPYPFYSESRRRTRVPMLDGIPMLVHFEDVQAALRDAACEAGMLRTSIDEVERKSGFPLAGLREALDGMLLFDGPPGHIERRRYLAKAMNSRPVAQFLPVMERMAAEAFSSLDLGAGADLMENVAGRFPARFFNTWFGFVEEDLPFLMDCAEGIFIPLVGEECAADQLIDINSKAAMALDLVESVIRERRQAPGDDGISRMIPLAPAGVTDRMLAARTYFLLLAGTESMRNFLGSAMWLLITHPEELAKLRDETVTPEVAIMELIRYESPVHSTYRVCREDRCYGEVTVPAGTMFMLNIGAAHRDPEVYSTPDRLMLDRLETANLGFADGPHSCLGAGLAKMLGRAVLKEFIKLPPLKLMKPVEWTGNFTMRRPENLTVRH